jgi:hypothetical protein
MGNPGWWSDTNCCRSSTFSQQPKSWVTRQISPCCCATVVYGWGTPGLMVKWITQANGAIQFCASDQAFCALKEDHTVFAWGSPDHGGVIPETEANFCRGRTYHFPPAVLLLRRSLIWFCHVWGNERFGGKAPTNLQTVSHVVGSTTAFCALGRGGGIVRLGRTCRRRDSAHGFAQYLLLTVLSLRC